MTCISFSLGQWTMEIPVSHDDKSSAKKSRTTRGWVFVIAIVLVVLMASSVVLRGYYFKDLVGTGELTRWAGLSEESSAKERYKSKTVPIPTPTPVAQICVDDDVCADDIGGEWVLDKNKTFAAPVCCGWDKRHYEANPAQCGKRGMNNTWYSGNPNYYQQIGGKACTCANFKDKYTWRSSQELPDWEATETCRLLGNRTVLFIGDSSMQQFATILMNSIFPVGCQTQLRMALGDTLIHENMGAKNRGRHWLDAVALVKPDIVIMTAGAHVRNETKFKMLIDTVTTQIMELRKWDPKVTVVWKTQSPGGCSADITYPKPSGEFFNTSSLYEQVYQHAQFFARDVYAIQHFQKLRIPLLDLRMLYSRSDAHVSSQGRPGKDCLHFCVPGPLEVGNVLFQNLLATMQSNENL
jgi:hypothetical protein